MGKPRIFVTTDIGGADPDDKQSMAHLLVHADQFRIEGLVSSPSRYGGRTSDIHYALDKYGHDYNNLKSWSSEFPTPDALRSVVWQGKITPQPAQGWSTPTEASKALIAAAHKGSSADPLWVQAWGSLTDVAQALHDDPTILAKIRLYSMGGWNTEQDRAARDYIYNSHKNLWWIESDYTDRGIFVDRNGNEINSWKMADAIGHGALGQYFHDVRPWGLKMGDTPPVVYLMDKADDNNPTANSWGGRFIKTSHGPNYWKDNPDPALKGGAHYNGTETIRIHQAEIYADLAKRFDWAKSPNPNAGGGVDDPVLANHDQAHGYKDTALKVAPLANDQAPDGGKAIARFDTTTKMGGSVTSNGDGTLTYKPKTGFVGDDSFSYTMRDGDGDTDGANVLIKVSGSAAPTPPPPNGGGSTGTGGVTAGTDYQSTAKDQTLWHNSKYLTFNDKSPAGGLKVTQVDATSKAGVKINWAADGTMTYKPPAGWEGADSFQYTVKDAAGGSARGTIMVTVGSGAGPMPAPSPDETDSPVHAAADTMQAKAGKDWYFNTKYLTWNDRGPDGGLRVTQLDATSAKGVKVDWAADGTAIYRTPAGGGGGDTLKYTVQDVDGSSAVGTIFMQIGLY